MLSRRVALLIFLPDSQEIRGGKGEALVKERSQELRRLGGDADFPGKLALSPMPIPAPPIGQICTWHFAPTAAAAAPKRISHGTVLAIYTSTLERHATPWRR
jgi:hypothetical protein